MYAFKIDNFSVEMWEHLKSVHINKQYTNYKNALLQIFFDHKTHTFLFIPTGNIRRLLPWIKDNLLKERPELFIQGESVYETLFIVYRCIIICLV